MDNFLQELVSEAAEKRPDSPSFRDGDSTLSYAQLEQQSNQLANMLREYGLQAGDRVAVFLPRCTLTAVAVYGILKAGGVFVPVDPTFSAAALNNVLQSCTARFLLTKSSKVRTLRQLLNSEHPIEVLIGMEDEQLGDVPALTATVPWTALTEFDSRNGTSLAGQVSEESPAYIMYSSGSTGAPKGITHSHRSGLAYAKYSVEAYSVGHDDVIANHSPLNFDMSTFGYFSSCLACASTLIIPAAYAKMPASLASLCSEHRVTIWYSVPLALAQMLRSGAIHECDLSSLRWILYGGEPFPVSELRELMRLLPQAEVSNVYGPAEVNQCTIYNVPRSLLDGAASNVPIGQVWEGAQGLLLSDDNEIVEGDQPGELVIASDTMMLGYWARPDLDERAYYFYDNQGKSTQYYRTGDWVRRDSDGNLWFLGRHDRQIKIRGYRVELDAIERELHEHSAIQEACVFWIRKDGEKEIRSQVVSVGNAPLDVNELREFLRNRISPYAVPAQIDIVDTLPRNSNGKTDRVSLRRHAEEALLSSDGGVPCR